MSEPVKIERRNGDRGKPTVIFAPADGLAFMKREGFTGEFTGQCINGEWKRVELPNPDGWRRS